jgi:hypothetical protein
MQRSWAPSVLLLALLALGVSRADDGDGFIHVLGAPREGERASRPLHLVAERPLEKLLDDDGTRLEASGVVARGDWLYVVFDDTTDVARVRDDLSEAEWLETDGSGPGYEGIAWSPEEQRFHCVIESDKRDGNHYGRVATYDASFSLIDEAWLRIPLSSDNKGFEGLAVVHREGKAYVLALHEGHPDDARSDGSVRGRIEVFAQKGDGDGWRHEATLKLPKDVRFADWSGLDIRDGRVAVTSQQSSALWLGELAADEWAFTGEGETYLFPRDGDGDPRYLTIEGVALLDRGRVAVVTDLDKTDTARRDRAIHIFALRAGAE